MPHIVERLRSNLLLQILLELNIYILYIWAGCFLYQAISMNHAIGLSLLLVLALAITAEGLRVYASFVLNLGASRSVTFCWVICILALGVPNLPVMWYFLVNIGGSFWLSLLWNFWLIIVAMETILTISLLWYNN